MPGVVWEPVHDHKAGLSAVEDEPILIIVAAVGEAEDAFVGLRTQNVF
jgi:hypothetical protein